MGTAALVLIGAHSYAGDRYHEKVSPDDPSLALECWLKAIRALQGTAWQRDQGHFVRLAATSCSLADAYCRAAQVENPRRNLSAARMHLRGVLRAAEQRYSGLAEYVALQTALDSVQRALDEVASA